LHALFFTWYGISFGFLLYNWGIRSPRMTHHVLTF